MTMTPAKKADYLASIHASYAISAMDEFWYAMIQLADLYIKQEETQIASDILAFVLLQDGIATDIYEQADALFDELERRICPRVIWDAKSFANDMDIEGMVEHILDI